MRDDDDDAALGGGPSHDSVGKPGLPLGEKSRKRFWVFCVGWEWVMGYVVDGDWRNRKSLILLLTFTIFEPMGMLHARL